MSRLTTRIDVGWAVVEEILYEIPSDTESMYDIHAVANEYTDEEFMEKYGYTEEEKILPRECADVLEKISIKLCNLEDLMDKYQIESVEELEDDLKTLKWLVQHLYIASGLVECRIASLSNHRWDDWCHNGIPVQDKQYDAIHKILLKLESKYKK